MSLPPGYLAQQLVKAFPQFILNDANLNNLLNAHLNPTSNQSLSDFIQWLQDHQDIATQAGDVLNPDGDPQTISLPLNEELIQAFSPLLLSTSSWIITQDPFEGTAWTIQEGIVPGAIQAQERSPAWTLTTQTPIGGLACSEIAYSANPSRQFILTLRNNAPRHLSVYASFSNCGLPVVPVSWTSRLPDGAPSAFECESVKYLGILTPNVAVGGMHVATTPQSLVVPLPINTDSVQLMFGGLGNSEFHPLPDAAGVLMTLVIDILVPWIVAYSGCSKTNLSAWLATLLADYKLMANILTSGADLLNTSSTSEMYSFLSTSLTSMILGESLTALRSSIQSELGAKPGVTYSWVDQLAPAAGWASQMVRAFLASGCNPQYWAACAPATITINLSSFTSLALTLTIKPDPKSRIWPYSAQSTIITIGYGRGFSQTLTQKLPQPQSDASIVVAFGSVPNGGPITVAVAILDGASVMVAQTQSLITPPVEMTSREIAMTLRVSDRPVTISSATKYTRVAYLSYSDGAYTWKSCKTSPPETKQPRSGTEGPAVTELVCLTLQGDQACLGYAWRASNQHVHVCGANTPLQNAYFLQNIAITTPADQLKTMACGLAERPQLAYAPIADEQSSASSFGYYLDTQASGIFLRQITFGPGTFNFQIETSVAQFPSQSGTLSLCVHPAGYAAVCNAEKNILQIVRLASTAASDATAPMAVAYGGMGSRSGLMNVPIAISVFPNGSLIVLEQGNNRVQSFDINGNPVPMFAGESFFPLRTIPNPRYRDLAISSTGMLFVLGSQNDGATTTDFFLDIYNPDGSLLTSNLGVNAARFVIDSGLSLYTLDFDHLIGLYGRSEPIISLWRP